MKFVFKARLKIKEDKKNEGFHIFYAIELDEITFLFTLYNIPYARHYNPRFVFFLPQFSLRFIFESGLYCREVSNYMNLFSSKVAIKIG